MTQIQDDPVARELRDIEHVPVPRRPSYWTGFAWDFTESIKRWQLWWLLGYNDVRQRYRRSRVGQFWITLSMGIFIVAIGPVYAILFATELKEFLPYLTVNIVVWSFISSMINDSCT